MNIKKFTKECVKQIKKFGVKESKGDVSDPVIFGIDMEFNDNKNFNKITSSYVIPACAHISEHLKKTHFRFNKAISFIRDIEPPENKFYPKSEYIGKETHVDEFVKVTYFKFKKTDSVHIEILYDKVS